MPRSTHNYSPLEYVLLALIPYTQPNLALSFAPKRFFYELEILSRKKRSALQTAYSQAQKRGFIDTSTGKPLLTHKGTARIKPYTATKLRKQVQLMVAFDIPEYIAPKRRQLRTFLRLHNFTQAQKSLWLTDLDYREELKAVIADLEIEKYVDVFECAKVKI